MDIDLLWRRRRPPEQGLGVSLHIDAGTRLTVEGTHGCEFFIIEAGRAVVRRHDREVALLGEGDHFGEIALLEPRTPRTASVVAVEGIQVHVFDRREFGTLLDRDPAMAERVHRGMGAPPGRLNRWSVRA